MDLGADPVLALGQVKVNFRQVNSDLGQVKVISLEIAAGVI